MIGELAQLRARATVGALLLNLRTVKFYVIKQLKYINKFKKHFIFQCEFDASNIDLLCVETRRWLRAACALVRVLVASTDDARNNATLQWLRGTSHAVDANQSDVDVVDDVATIESLVRARSELAAFALACLSPALHAKSAAVSATLAPCKGKKQILFINACIV